MDKTRIGMFTSSNIHKLMTNGTGGVGLGKPAVTYIKEKIRERKLGIEINLEASGYPVSWGKALEGFVFEKFIGIEYAIESTSTDVHESGMWCGTKDLISKDCIADIKCPYTRSSFCDLVDIIESGSTEVFKKENPEYYYQLVSNSLLCKKPYAELIIYMPLEKEIPEIIEYIDEIEDFQLQKDIQWVIHSDIKRIPHLPNEGGYNNLYRFKFLVPEEDKTELFERIKLAHNNLK
jgi:hypothetical protein